MAMPKVFIINAQNSHIDIVNAAKGYGKPIILSSADFQVDRASKHIERNKYTLKQLESLFKDYVPNHDFIIPCGSPVIIMALGTILPPGTHNILKWNRAKFSYDHCTLLTPV